jgi:hypothetical protein
MTEARKIAAILAANVVRHSRLASRVDEAARLREQACSELLNHGHGPSVAQCTLAAVAFPEVMFGDLEAAERHCAELVAHCAEREVEQWRILSNCLRA